MIKCYKSMTRGTICGEYSGPFQSKFSAIKPKFLENFLVKIEIIFENLSFVKNPNICLNFGPKFKRKALFWKIF